jgi:DNA-binding GntR family transcriptional regulator
MIEALAITPVRLGDLVAERIADAIMDGTLPAGARVRDSELATQLGVSRMPVREALQRLQRVGLIETAASRYTRVTEVSPQLARDTRDFAAHFMVSAVRMVLARATAAERSQTAAQIEEIADRALAEDDLLAARRMLQELLTERTGNEFMQLAASDLGIAIQRNLSGVEMPLRTPRAAAENYRELATAVRDGDGDAAERLIRRQFGLDAA